MSFKLNSIVHVQNASCLIVESLFVSLNISVNLHYGMSEDYLGGLFKAFNIQTQQFNQEAKNSFDQFMQVLKTAAADASKKTIEAKIKGDQDSSQYYKTELVNEVDIINEFPNNIPNDNDVYWRRHNELVNEALTTRKEIILKVIDTAGATIKGIINPISVSTIDLAKLVEVLKKS
jgi:hypothetical protein